MDNSNSNNLDKKDKKVKNTILIISIIYFLFVLEESQDAKRIKFYKLLILISTIFLFLTNFKFLKQIFLEYIIRPFKIRIFDREDDDIRDDTKKILEYLFQTSIFLLSSQIINSLNFH